MACKFSQVRPWAIYTLIFLCGVIAAFAALFDELSINPSVQNDYDEEIVLKCGWKSLHISIDGMEYEANYDNRPRTRQAGKGFITFLSIGFIFMVLLFIPPLLDYIPCCCNCFNHIKRSKIFTLRAGVICMGFMWIIASVDWTSTEHCCKNWSEDIDIDNIYYGTDCDWYISIYALLSAAFMSLFIAFYSICIWDVDSFKSFNDEEYFHMV
mmetsp:Transcript_7986/g.7202  ORF Transcript_7986/g.7202 Transcript_7986/m.7202 type:complete len:211 (-) Transcript_7986:170-802(-)